MSKTGELWLDDISAVECDYIEGRVDRDTARKILARLGVDRPDDLLSDLEAAREAA